MTEKLRVTNEMSSVLDKVSLDWSLFRAEFYDLEGGESRVRHIVVIDDTNNEWEIVVEKAKTFVEYFDENIGGTWGIKRIEYLGMPSWTAASE